MGLIETVKKLLDNYFPKKSLAMEPIVRTRIAVREVMNSPVVTSGPDESIREVAEKMAEYKIGSIVIVDSKKPVGIVTETDIVAKSVAQGGDPLSTKAIEIMSRPLITIGSGGDVTEAAKLMRKHSVKRLGVTHDDELVGIVSVSDLTAVTPELLDLVSEKARLMTGEQLRVSAPLAGYCDICGEWSDYLKASDGRYLCENCYGDDSREDLPTSEEST